MRLGLSGVTLCEPAPFEPPPFRPPPPFGLPLFLGLGSPPFGASPFRVATAFGQTWLTAFGQPDLTAFGQMWVCVGPRRVGPRTKKNGSLEGVGRGPTFRVFFFPLPPQFSFFLSLSWGVLPLEFWCCFWMARFFKRARLEFSGCRVKPAVTLRTNQRRIQIDSRTLQDLGVGELAAPTVSGGCQSAECSWTIWGDIGLRAPVLEGRGGER